MHIPWALQHPLAPAMDAIIDLNDASKALDLDRIRYQLMSVSSRRGVGTDGRTEEPEDRS
jgi:hypothetical protein